MNFYKNITKILDYEIYSSLFIYLYNIDLNKKAVPSGTALNIIELSLF